jgi:carbonic anhydrase
VCKVAGNFVNEDILGSMEYVTCVAKDNIKHALETIKLKSPTLKDMADKGEIKIVGAFYDLETGAVTFME